jgi:hypothetical protein
MTYIYSYDDLSQTALSGIFVGSILLSVWWVFDLLQAWSPEEEIEKKLRECRKMGNVTRK